LDLLPNISYIGIMAVMLYIGDAHITCSTWPSQL